MSNHPNRRRPERVIILTPTTSGFSFEVHDMPVRGHADGTRETVIEVARSALAEYERQKRDGFMEWWKEVNAALTLREEDHITFGPARDHYAVGHDVEATVNLVIEARVAGVGV